MRASLRIYQHLPRLPFTLVFLFLTAVLAIGCKDTATVRNLASA